MTSIPFLPGNTVQTSQKSSHNKTHQFDVVQGIRVSTNPELLAGRSFQPMNAEANLSIAKTSADFDATQTMSNTANMRNLPAWVAYDRKVLRFYAYFKEAVFSSAAENFRVRKCTIYYYLEDQSIHVAEPKTENSGIPQGVFIKRHRIPKPDNQYVDLNDLACISNEVTLYGRVFRIVDCDDFTRQFLRDNGVDVGVPEDTPMDPFTTKHTTQPKDHFKKMYAMKEHMEATLGKMMGVNIEYTKKFLEFDRKVLCFYVWWNDHKFFGKQQTFRMHYFLADDTVEVLEVNTPNSGQDPFPTFLKRQRLPKDHNTVRPDISRIGWSADKSVQYVTKTDLRIGATVNVFGRSLYICACDGFTKDYYMKNYNMPEEAFEFKLFDEPPPNAPELMPPPHNGFGSEEDSLGSFLYLQPKVPKIDFKKLMQNDGLNMRFTAKMVNPKPEDADRRFNITFYMNDDTLSIFECFQRNSGFVGGKFLERSKLVNAETGNYFEPSDFSVGRILTINRYRFELLDTDEYTRKFMNESPAVFGMAPAEGALEATVEL